MKDLEVERAALMEYGASVRAMRDDRVVAGARRGFYNHLDEDLYVDWQHVDQEYRKIFFMASELDMFEYEQLDNDGKTTRLGKMGKEGSKLLLRIW